MSFVYAYMFSDFLHFDMSLLLLTIILRGLFFPLKLCTKELTSVIPDNSICNIAYTILAIINNILTAKDLVKTARNYLTKDPKRFALKIIINSNVVL